MKRVATLLLSFVTVLLFVQPARGSGDPKKLESTPQAKAYLAQLAAVQAGDWGAYEKASTKKAFLTDEKLMKATKKTPKAMLTVISHMAPKEVTFTSLEVEGNKATLTASGMLDGAMNKGTIRILQEDGQWKVDGQSWSDAK
ncbi:MAG TPA: hypothetical protein VKH46_16710 [Thermoanaerobaculia bacterium]|nr:hypothetical protein [Thermoanaerobaculia bacterium]